MRREEYTMILNSDFCDGLSGLMEKIFLKLSEFETEINKEFPNFNKDDLTDFFKKFFTSSINYAKLVLTQLVDYCKWDPDCLDTLDLLQAEEMLNTIDNICDTKLISNFIYNTYMESDIPENEKEIIKEVYEVNYSFTKYTYSDVPVFNSTIGKNKTLLDISISGIIYRAYTEYNENIFKEVSWDSILTKHLRIAGFKISGENFKELRKRDIRIIYGL